MGFGGKAQKQQGSQLSSGTKNITGTTDPTFNSPESQAILARLSGTATDTAGTDYLHQAGNTYGAIAGGGDSNPYIEALIHDQNAVGDRTFQNRLAGTRAGAYRGGTGANMFGQGKLAADFTNQQSAQNNQLRADNYNTGQARKLAAAGGLADLGGGQASLAAQILAMLRGQKINQNEASSGRTDTNENSFSGGFSFGGY